MKIPIYLTFSPLILSAREIQFILEKNGEKKYCQNAEVIFVKQLWLIVLEIWLNLIEI